MTVSPSSSPAPSSFGTGGIGAWVLDLDGVVWRGDTPVPGSIAAIDRLRTAGERVLFLTNNSSATIAGYVAKMAQMGLHADPADVCTSAQASALVVTPGETALVCGGIGITEALSAVGVRCVADYEPGIDVVVAGWHRDFSFDRLTQAFMAIRAGARLVGTNDDPTYPTAEGELPGGGAIVAAIAYAAGVDPVFAGKPHEPSAQLVFSRLGWSTDPSAEQRSSLVMVGDRPSTDGGMSVTLGARFALVLSGVTAPADLPVHPAPAVVASDLAALVDEHLG
jgi:HAD superfamily hydrolase (TIGR01450 family)